MKYPQLYAHFKEINLLLNCNAKQKANNGLLDTAEKRFYSRHNLFTIPLCFMVSEHFIIKGNCGNIFLILVSKKVIFKVTFGIILYQISLDIIYARVRS